MTLITSFFKNNIGKHKERQRLGSSADRIRIHFRFTVLPVSETKYKLDFENVVALPNNNLSLIFLTVEQEKEVFTRDLIFLSLIFFYLWFKNHLIHLSVKSISSSSQITSTIVIYRFSLFTVETPWTGVVLVFALISQKVCSVFVQRQSIRNTYIWFHSTAKCCPLSIFLSALPDIDVSEQSALSPDLHLSMQKLKFPWWDDFHTFQKQDCFARRSHSQPWGIYPSVPLTAMMVKRL